jgi:hypothetical protein
MQTRPYLGRAPYLELPEATLPVPRNLGVEDADSRREVVRGWLTKLFLDMGLNGFEENLQALA